MLAFVVGGLAILIAYRIVGRQRPGPVARGFRLGQLVSGEPARAVARDQRRAEDDGNHLPRAGRERQPARRTPTCRPGSWSRAASAIALGTYVGGWRIIRTMGSRIIKMDPAQGFAAQSVGATVILAASHVGFPLSTTHVISGAIMGTGAAKRVSAVRWGVAGNIVTAWVLTLPAAAIVGRRSRTRVVALLGTDEARPGRRLGRAARRAGGGAGRRLVGRADADGGGLMTVFAVDGASALAGRLGLAGRGRRDQRAVLARDPRGRARERRPPRRARRAAAALRGARRRSRSLLFAAGVVLGVQAMITK